MTENKITVFENTEFGKVRTVTIDGEPWLVGKDVCLLFGDKNHNRSLGRVDEFDKRKVDLSDSLNRTQSVTIINESGLYALLFAMQPQKAHNGGVSDEYPIEIRERIEKLHKFKRWITSEVLPTLRKVGSYSLEQKPDSYTIDDPIARAKRWIEEKEEYLVLENKIKEDKPLVDFANKILSSDSSISMNDMAKLVAKNGIKIGRNRLFRLLRGKGILDSRNVPYQRYIEVQPWFETTEFTYYANGKNNISITTKVTPKGQVGIVKMLTDSHV